MEELSIVPDGSVCVHTMYIQHCYHMYIQVQVYEIVYIQIQYMYMCVNEHTVPVMLVVTGL